MGIWRAIWNGPFYIGKLERPVSVGDAIMKVLETLWRSALVFVAAVAAIIAQSNYSNWSRNRDNAAARETTEIVATYNPVVCGDHQPIMVVIGNAGRRKLTEVRFEVEILDRPGLSGRTVANIGAFSDSPPAEDIAPGKEVTICRSLGRDPRYWPRLSPEMIIQARVKFATFRDDG